MERRGNEPAPRLTTLTGTSVVLTGRFSTTQAELARRIALVGGRVASAVSSQTEVLAQGQPTPAYKFGSEGVKLVEAEERRADGQLIYVISERELGRLLVGKGLSLVESAAAASGDRLFGAGIAFRPSSVSPSTAVRPASIEIDLELRERRLRQHHELAAKVAEHLRAAGKVPLSPGALDCQYDLAWQAGRETVHLVEVKTITAKNEVQQMRLGLGQVLEYRETLRARGWRARAHLVVSRQPAAEGVARACAACDVSISWPGEFDRLLGRPSGS